MKRTILFAIGGVLLGGIIHIAVVFMVPYYADHDAWAQLDRFNADDRFQVLAMPEPGAEPLSSLDPRMMHAVCRFSLGSGPIRITATLPDQYLVGRDFRSPRSQRIQPQRPIGGPNKARSRDHHAGANGSDETGAARSTRDGDRRRDPDQRRFRAAEGLRSGRHGTGRGNSGPGNGRVRGRSLKPIRTFCAAGCGRQVR